LTSVVGFDIIIKSPRAIVEHWKLNSMSKKYKHTIRKNGPKIPFVAQVTNTSR